jgi:hypothetical protein
MWDASVLSDKRAWEGPFSMSSETTARLLRHSMTARVFARIYFLLLTVGSCTTMSRNSRSGATMISCFFERMRRKVRSLVGSRSRTTLRALAVGGG